jgi:hypothetical protein
MATTGRIPVIAFDGNESTSGRALLCLSALYHCSDRLHGVGLRLIDVANPDVLLAAEALHWDVGLAVDVRPAGSAGGKGSPLAGVSLYAGIACGSARHMRLDEAVRRHIPTMVAMQFPDEDEVCQHVLQEDAAFDPQLFAEALMEAAGRLDVPHDTWLASALVAPKWYRETYPDAAAADLDPVEHYFTTGWREGHDPNAWFATRWYLDQNPGLRQAEESPLHHFVREGAQAGCRPHPDFDIAWYSRHHLGLDFPSHVALRHFLALGERDGLAPKPALHTPPDDLAAALVDADWYRTAYPEVAADPVQHYIEAGWRDGRDPNAWFATRWYLDQNPGVSEADESPLHHFVRDGAFAGRRPHPDFDVIWYSRHQLGLDYASPEALRHFLTIGLATGCAPKGGLNHRAIRDRLPRQSATERSAVLKRLARLQRAPKTGKRWDDSEAELWPVLLAREVPEGRITVLVLFDDASESILGVARLLGWALPMQEFPLFAMVEGSNRLKLFDRLDDPQVALDLDLPEQIAGLRHIAQTLPVGRAVVTDEKLRHGDHVRWLRDAGIPVFINGPRREADD